MEKNKKLEKLDTMLGKQYEYNGRTIKLLTYKITDGIKIQIITDDQEWIEDTIFNLGVTLDSFKEIESNELPEKLSHQPVTLPKDDLIENLEQMLFDDIKKVRDSSDYIEQAKQTQSTAKAIIDARKLRIEQAKFINDTL